MLPTSNRCHVGLQMNRLEWGKVTVKDLDSLAARPDEQTFVSFHDAQVLVNRAWISLLNSEVLSMSIANKQVVLRDITVTDAVV